MSIYTTPLQFGYFLALSMTMLFWSRGYREERLSDILLGWVMFFLAMEIQDYTFGFAGINFLWDQMNGFPRGTALLFGPSVYFYLRSQINSEFRISSKHFIHLLPWFISFVVDLTIFLNGPEAVQGWQSSELNVFIGYCKRIILWGSYIYYFSMSLSLYKRYRVWAQTQFSNQDMISFIWFRNLLYFMISGIIFKETMGIIDQILDLDFYQDWWWNLAMVAIIFYVGIWGYAQVQPAVILFNSVDERDPTKISPKEQVEDLSLWKSRIEKFMDDQKPYLESQLTLKSLSQMLKSNPTIISAAINQNFGKNFNDFVNEYRVNEFLTLSKKGEFDHYTLLALALECGFNSKSTFNRAFKKIKGVTPKEMKAYN